tara:strand:+ start:72 stop:314 length:243 start_codon:yes stop_codon:yes gene_type:complete
MPKNFMEKCPKTFIYKINKKFFGHPWWLLATPGGRWPPLVAAGHPWWSLATPGGRWPPLVVAGHTSGGRKSPLVAAGNPW